MENIAFDAAPEEVAPAPTGIGTQVTEIAREHWPAALRGVAILLIALFALFGVLRPLARRATGLANAPALPAATVAGARLPTVQEMEGQIEAELDGPNGARILAPGSRERSQWIMLVKTLAYDAAMFDEGVRTACTGRGRSVPVLPADTGRQLFDAVLLLDERWRQVPWHGTLELELPDA